MIFSRLISILIISLVVYAVFLFLGMFIERNRRK